MAITSIVNINSRSGPADVLGTPFVCTAVAEGTFAELRAVLNEDEIVQDRDKAVFILPDGKVVGKSSEAHLKWKTALKVGLQMTTVSMIPDSVVLQDGEVDIIRLTHPVRNYCFSVAKKNTKIYAVCRSGCRRRDVNRSYVSDPEHYSTRRCAHSTTTSGTWSYIQRAFIPGTFLSLPSLIGTWF